ncbi:MAG: hypothetical protein KQH63_11765 [Desulfobulbaceae bacterium]|nr:hypothetical protein [Desulfobulbaceae bacterium]
MQTYIINTHVWPDLSPAGHNKGLRFPAPAWLRLAFRLSFHATRVLFIFAVLTPITVLVTLQMAHGQNYSSRLVNGLFKLGYPLDRQSVIALDKISMRFNAPNRIDVLNRILGDRHKIHSMEEGEHFIKTQVVCDALRLLDELDLPVTRDIVEKLVGEKGWEEKERRILSYMAAKRDIDFETNIQYLIRAMPRQGADLQEEWDGEISLAIMDICDNLSYLAELFVLRGDPAILNALVNYAGQAYGYPKEHLSYMFVETLLARPHLFVAILSARDEVSVRQVVKSLFFARWTNNVREKIEALLDNDFAGSGYSDNEFVTMMRRRLARFPGNSQDLHDIAEH